MHTIKLLLTYYLNISVQAANLLDCRIESNRNFFCPNWNALVRTTLTEQRSTDGRALSAGNFRASRRQTFQTR